MEEQARRQPKTRRVVATAGLLALIVAGGCGGGSSAAPQGSGTDVATAARINLRQSDFPAGWQGRSNPVTASGNVQAERALYACLGAPSPASHTTANVNSPVFVQSSQQASSNVKFTRKAAQSQADYGTLAQPAAGDCARRVLVSTLPGALPFGSTVASSAESSVPATAAVGDQAAAFYVTVDLDVRGGRTTVYADFITIRRGRALVAVQMIGLGEESPSSLREAIVSNVESRASQVPE
jgi:hypothetical protein